MGFLFRCQHAGMPGILPWPFSQCVKTTIDVVVVPMLDGVGGKLNQTSVWQWIAFCCHLAEVRRFGPFSIGLIHHRSDDGELE